MSHDTNMALVLLYTATARALRAPYLIPAEVRMEMVKQFDELARLGRSVVLEGLMEEAVKEKS